MWAEACDLLERSERLRRHFFRPAPIAAWEPPVDVFETEREVWIVVALPGVSAGDVKIALADGRLVVAGERRLPVGPDAVIRRLEIPHGRLERSIPLPPGRYELQRHDCADGCLTIGLRKLG
jgi:HSP20 family molecular chaperone IbpA